MTTTQKSWTLKLTSGEYLEFLITGENAVVSTIDKAGKRYIYSEQMPTSAAREEWSAIRAYSIPVNSETLRPL